MDESGASRGEANRSEIPDGMTTVEMAAEKENQGLRRCSGGVGIPRSGASDTSSWDTQYLRHCEGQAHNCLVIRLIAGRLPFVTKVAAKVCQM